MAIAHSTIQLCPEDTPMTEELFELTLDDLLCAEARDRVREHFKAAIDFLDEELGGTGRAQECPQLLASFVQATALESLGLSLMRRSSVRSVSAPTIH